jgi:hypothetical protein
VASAAKGLAAGFGVGLGAGTITGLATATRQAFAWADALQESAQRIGVNVEMLQRLQRAGQLTNVSQEQITNNLQQFARRLGDAASGTGQFAKVLQQNNIELRNQDGSLRSVSAVFDDFANRIAAAATEQEARSLAVAAFGRGGAAFVTTIREIQASPGEFDVLTREQIEKLAEYDDKITETSLKFEFEFKKRLVTIITEVERLSQALGLMEAPRIDELTSQLSTVESQLRAVQETANAGAQTFADALVRLLVTRIASVLSKTWSRSSSSV